MFIVLLAAPRARADGLKFVDGLPASPHVVLALTPGQQAQVAATPVEAFAGFEGLRSLTLALTESQRTLLRKSTRGQVAPRWLDVKSRPFFEHDCTCGSFNVAVLLEGRIAVLLEGLTEPEPSAAELGLLVARVVDPTIDPGRSPLPVPACRLLDGEEAATPTHTSPHLEALRRLASELPHGWTLKLPDAWDAWAIKAAAIPRAPPWFGAPLEGRIPVGDGHARAEPPLQLARLKLGERSRARTLTWPATASLRQDAPGTRTVLLAGIDPRGRDGEPLLAWLLVRFVGEDAVAILAFSASGAPGDGGRVEVVRTKERTVVVEERRDAYVCEGL